MQQYIDTFEYAAKDRRTEVEQVGDAAVAGITEDDLRHFKYREHAENVALSLAVCESLGVSREDAMRDKLRASSDPTALHALLLDVSASRAA